MPVPTRIKFKKYCKAVEIIVGEKFAKFSKTNKSGTGIRYEIFENRNDDVPCAFWVVHQKEVIYSDDLKKTCKALGITQKEFASVVDRL